MKKYILIISMMLLMCLISGCSEEAVEAVETVDGTTIEQQLRADASDSALSSSEDGTANEASAEESSADTDETEPDTISTTNDETDETDNTAGRTNDASDGTEEAEPTLAEGETTAEVEEGETNESGVIDGQPLSSEEATASETTTASSDPSEIVSDMPYLIMVNRQANCVTVYTKDDDGKYTVPVKAMVCSCARDGYTTPLGTFQISDHYVWRELYGNVYGYYSVRITGSILFHSVPYYQPNPSLIETEEYDKLGENASQGCIRLQVKDSKWIYDNCAAGTYVIIYDDEDPGPLGKPTAMKISSAREDLAGWDPTDPTEGNPWNSCTTLLTVEETSVDVKMGDEIDLENYASAIDWQGNEAEITISGEVDTEKVGTYKVTYSVTDFNGYTDSVTVKFKVSKITPTPTPTPTKKATSTPTPTPTKKATATPTPTKKVTATPTPTKKATSTPTPTPTKKATSTPTPTPTKKATSTPTPTPTKKPTSTPTPTPTKKPTSTPTPTPTKKPTSTPTPTPTKKPTSTPTPTPTPTPKPTATSTPTPTPKPTATSTPTPKPTSTSTPTPTPPASESETGDTS